MKNSGIPWVHEIPESWKVLRSKYCFSLVKEIVGSKVDNYDRLSLTLNGVLKRSKDDTDGLQPDNFSGYQILRNGQLVFKLIDLQNVSTSRIGLSPFDGIVSPAYVILNAKENMFASYAEKYYKMMWMNQIFNSLGDSGVRSSLSATELLDLKMPVPPIDEQIRISGFLDKRIGEIEKAEKTINEEIETIESFKAAKVKEIFDSYLKYDHYYVKLGRLSTLVTKQTGFDYTNTIQPSLVDELNDDTMPYLQTRHFKDNYFNFETEYYIPKKVAKMFPAIILDSRCLLFSIVGASIGNVATYPGNTVAFLGGAICKVSLKDDSLYDYVKYYMMSTYGQDQILININSSAQGTITVQNVRDFKIPIFKDDSIHKKITQDLMLFFENYYSIIEDRNAQLENLKKYKLSLIYEYVTGKKEVPNE